MLNLVEKIFILTETKIRKLNARQNFLIKNSLNINSFARKKHLLQALKIKSISQLKFKHKVFLINIFKSSDKRIGQIL